MVEQIAYQGVGCIPSLLRPLLRLLGITDEPNLMLGISGRLELVLTSALDMRPGYAGWWHVGVANKQRAGLSRFLTTKDAYGCSVNLQFASERREGRIFEQQGVIMVGATELPKEIATLYREQETYIPVYLHTSDELMTGHPVTGPLPYGSAFVGGTYMTGANFLQASLAPTQLLPPDNYLVTVTLKYRKETSRVRFDLRVPGPDTSQLMPEAEHSALQSV